MASEIQRLPEADCKIEDCDDLGLERRQDLVHKAADGREEG